jgi:SLT domain-containing protein
MAIMNTAAGVTKALALPFPFNLVVAGIVGAAGAVQIAAIASQSYQGRQTGGLVQGGTPYMVGEQGPELFMPNQTGTIIPNRNMSGGQTVNVTFDINTVDAKGMDELLTARRGTITNIIREATQQNGQRSMV